MEDYEKKYKDLKNEYEKLQNENNRLRNEHNNQPPLNFAKALEKKIINSVMGNDYDDEISQAFRREHENNPHLCDQKYFSWNCCFSKDTEITVKENNILVKKKIFEIKKDDLIMTLVNGEKTFTKVKYTKEYNDEFQFYQLKCMKDNKFKSITVTNNHIMIVYDKNMKELKYKTAENIIKNCDYFMTVDGLYQVVDVNIFNMKFKYALGVDEGAILADDILVSCLNMNDVSKNLSLNEIIEKYKINIL